MLVVDTQRNNVNYDRNSLKQLHLRIVYLLISHFPYKHTQSNLVFRRVTMAMDVCLCEAYLQALNSFAVFDSVKNATLIRSAFHAYEFSLLVDRKAIAIHSRSSSIIKINSFSKPTK